MNIVCDATALYGSFGGIETALFQTLKHLSELDSELDSAVQMRVCVPRNCPLPNDVFGSRFPLHRLAFNGENKGRRIVWQQLELPIFARKMRADWLFCPTYVAPLVASTPIVLGVPDLIALNQSRFAARANRLHYRAIMPRSLKRANRIIATTPPVEAEIKRRVPDAQIRVVPLGVESAFFDSISPFRIQKIREKYDLPPRFLLFVGNLEPKKNLPNLLRAVEQLGDLPLVIVGGIKPWRELESFKTQTQFLGFVPRADLPPLFVSCEVFCFPSLCEGFGMPVLEALACGARVVASTRVPIPDLETVAQTPNPHSPQAIAEAIRVELDATQPSIAGQKFAREFSWNRTARQTLAVFENAR